MIGPLPERPCMHLDRGYDSRKTRDLLEILGYDAEIAVKGKRPDPGREALARRAHALVDERLRQAPPLHRPPQGHRRVLPLPRRRPHRHPTPDQPSPHPLPLANQTHHATPPLTIIRRALLLVSQGEPTAPATDPSTVL